MAIWVVALTTLVTSLAIVPMDESGMSMFCTSPCSIRLAALAFRLFGQVQSFHGIVVINDERYGVDIVPHLQTTHHHIQPAGSQGSHPVEEGVGRYLHAGYGHVLQQTHP